MVPCWVPEGLPTPPATFGETTEPANRRRRRTTRIAGPAGVGAGADRAVLPKPAGLETLLRCRGRCCGQRRNRTTALRCSAALGVPATPDGGCPGCPAKPCPCGCTKPAATPCGAGACPAPGGWPFDNWPTFTPPRCCGGCPCCPDRPNRQLPPFGAGAAGMLANQSADPGGVPATIAGKPAPGWPTKAAVSGLRNDPCTGTAGWCGIDALRTANGLAEAAYWCIGGATATGTAALAPAAAWPGGGAGGAATGCGAAGSSASAKKAATSGCLWVCAEESCGCGNCAVAGGTPRRPLPCDRGTAGATSVPGSTASARCWSAPGAETPCTGFGCPCGCTTTGGAGIATAAETAGCAVWGFGTGAAAALPRLKCFSATGGKPGGSFCVIGGPNGFGGP